MKSVVCSGVGWCGPKVPTPHLPFRGGEVWCGYCPKTTDVWCGYFHLTDGLAALGIAP